MLEQLLQTHALASACCCKRKAGRAGRGQASPQHQELRRIHRIAAGSGCGRWMGRGGGGRESKLSPGSLSQGSPKSTCAPRLTRPATLDPAGRCHYIITILLATSIAVFAIQLLGFHKGFQSVRERRSCLKEEDRRALSSRNLQKLPRNSSPCLLPAR